MELTPRQHLPTHYLFMFIFSLTSSIKYQIVYRYQKQIQIKKSDAETSNACLLTPHPSPTHPPLCDIVINWKDPPIRDYIIYQQPLIPAMATTCQIGHNYASAITELYWTLYRPNANAREERKCFLVSM